MTKPVLILGTLWAGRSRWLKYNSSVRISYNHSIWLEDFGYRKIQNIYYSMSYWSSIINKREWNFSQRFE